MTELLRLCGLGTRVEVRCRGERSELLASAMREAWSRCVDDGWMERGDASSADLVASPVQVVLDDEADLASRLQSATQDITRSLITAQIGRLLMFHAGAVSHVDTGETLVYVAAGGTGKTTLSRRLGTRFGYLTDETVAIDGSGVVFPYPKPLSVRRFDHPVKDEVSPDRLSLLPAPLSSHVTRVVLLDRRPASESAGVELEELQFMDALFLLAEQISSLAALDGPLQRLASLIDRVGPVIRVHYTEALDIEDYLAALIGGAL